MSSKHKPHCILHIGMHKTGSSSIQATLCKQPVSANFEFVNITGDGNSSGPLYYLFLENPELCSSNKRRGFSAEKVLETNQENLNKLKNILKATQANTVVISAEQITVLSEQSLYRLKNLILEYCRSIQIIGYVRPCIAYMQSALQQMVKEGESNFDLNNTYPFYRNKFEKFDNVFGKDQVLLIKYEASTLLDNDVVSDFCRRIGIVVDSEAIVRKNETLSLEALSLLYTYRRLGSGYGVGVNAIKENRLLVQSLSNIGHKKISFSSNLTQSILEKYHADIQWMETRLGCFLTEVLAPDTADSISSLGDFVILSTQYSNELKQLLFSKIQQDVATPQKIADWVHLLRMQLSGNSYTEQTSDICSAVQIEKLKSINFELSNLLKDIFISISYADSQLTVIDLRRKLIPLFQAGIEVVDDSEEIAFSVDAYQDGHIVGWIVNKSNPFRLSIELHTIQGKIGEGNADQFRSDLVDTVSVDGCCAFKIKVDPTINDFGDLMIIKVKNYNKYFYVNTSSIKGLPNATR